MTTQEEKYRRMKTSPQSPCNNVCEIEKNTGVCRGCFRTLEEIAAWSGMSDSEKLDVLQRVAQRNSREQGARKGLI